MRTEVWVNDDTLPGFTRNNHTSFRAIEQFETLPPGSCFSDEREVRVQMRKRHGNYNIKDGARRWVEVEATGRYQEGQFIITGHAESAKTLC